MRITSDEKATLLSLINLKTAVNSDVEGKNETIESFRGMLLADASGLDLDDVEQLESYGNEHKVDLMVVDGIATAITMGYLQSMNMDRSSENGIPEFGYRGISEKFTSVVACSLGVYPQSGKTTELIEGGLLVQMRDIEPKEYYDGDIYKQDIALLGKILLADLEDGYNKNMLDALRATSRIKTHLDSAIKDTLAVYTNLFEDSFGIRPYAGVLCSDGFYGVDKDSVDGRMLKEDRITLKILANRIIKKIGANVDISSKRQFDYDEIFSSDNVVFFPYKILEYAMGRESTLNITAMKYKPHASSAAWDSYMKDYVVGNVTDIIVRGFYKALEKCTGESFISDEFVSSVTNYEDVVVDYLSDNDDKVSDYIQKLEVSMTCAYLLSGFGFLDNQITSIKVRVSSGAGFDCFTSNVSDTRTLFDGLIKRNSNEVFSEPSSLTVGRTADNGIDISVHIFEYPYMVNPLLDKAEPLFGYTIQQMNQKRHVKSGWDKILIGESLSGKELYASKESDIPLQNQFVHNIYAGSRSGKGVMTMNILVSAIASGKPIFYLDRKPDMASMLYHIAPDMFVINGGQVGASFDIHGDFNEHSGSAMEGWRTAKAYLDSHPKLAELFGNPSTYASPIGDYFYLRAFVFAMGICAVRAALDGIKDAPEDVKTMRDNLLNGNRGILIVVDELTNYQGSVTALLSNMNSKLVLKALKLPDTGTINKKVKKLQGTFEEYQAKIKEATKESGRIAAQNKCDEILDELNIIKDEQAVYAATLFEKLKKNYTYLGEKCNADFGGKENNYSDIFVLGQQLEAPYMGMGDSVKDSNVFFPVTTPKDGNQSYYAAYSKNADFIRSYLERFSEWQDWFIGRNSDACVYGDKGINDQAKIVTDKDGNWEYFGNGTTANVRLGNTSSSLETGSVLFKPYLVLNENYEEDPANTTFDKDGNPITSDPKFQYVAQCAARVNKNAGGSDLWSTVRIKHLTPDAKERYSTSNPEYNHLQPGIGFRGLVAETMMTHGKQCTDADIAALLKQSGDIANVIADKMGYSCWQELIFDLSPRGLFSIQDMVDAVINPEAYNNLTSRYSLYSGLGMLDAVTGRQEDAVNFDTRSADDMYGDVEVEDSKEEQESTQSAQNTDSDLQQEIAEDASYEDAYQQFQQQLWGSEEQEPDEFDTDYDDSNEENVEDENYDGYFNDEDDEDYEDSPDVDEPDNTGVDDSMLLVLEINAIVEDIFNMLCKQYSSMGFDVSMSQDEAEEIKTEFREFLLRKAGV